MVQSIDIEKLRKVRNDLFIAFFPSLFVILIILLSFKDIFSLLKTTKKGIKKVYILFIIFGILFAAIGVIAAYSIINNKISFEEINSTVFSKCYNEKINEAKKEIMAECEKSGEDGISLDIVQDTVKSTGKIFQ